MKINGVELSFNLYDAESMDMKKRYYGELEKMQNVSNDLPNGTERERIIYLCDRIKEMFDSVFGDGTGQNVCGSGSDLLTCMDAYDQLVSEQLSQVKRYEAIMSKVKRHGKK